MLRPFHGGRELNPQLATHVSFYCCFTEHPFVTKSFGFLGGTREGDKFSTIILATRENEGEDERRKPLRCECNTLAKRGTTAVFCYAVVAATTTTTLL